MTHALGEQCSLNLEPFTLASSEFCSIFEANTTHFFGREVMLRIKEKEKVFGGTCRKLCGWGTISKFSGAVLEHTAGVCHRGEGRPRPGEATRCWD